MANAQTIQLTLKAIGDFSDVTSDISQVQQMLGKLKLPPALKKNFETTFAELTKETAKYQKILGGGLKKKGDVTGLESSGARISKLLATLKADMAKIDSSTLEKSFQIDPSKLDALTKKMKTLQSQLSAELGTNAFQKLNQNVTAVVGNLGKISKTKLTTNFADAFARGDIDGASQALTQLEANLKRFKEGSANKQQFSAGLDQLRLALDALKGNTELQRIRNEMALTDQEIDQLDANELQAFLQAFNQGSGQVGKMTQQVGDFIDRTNQAARSQMSFNSQLDQLKNQVSYFFGLTNAVYLLRNALRQALETVKELDEVMTQTAVVTDMSVGDMWDKLPQYTAEASALGIAVKDLYAATTLYYQQGLSGAKVMGVGIKTMKMAAIANMEAEEATQAMTAALRGFNMEVNEMNAERVSDVYSKLAAISASDTGQIATAMSKTASIAASANMEFETTAALLAQIIETTQEAPETAGTALKTIVARFSEVKNLRSKGERTGEDEEGETIDVNKIDKALKSVGISMNGFFAGTEGLGSILLKLSEKWTTLDFETQRYIATMAAGSRQQSRFMAMMSDYGRTTELVAAAQNSAGASQQQWEKTTEALGHKLNQLKNAWDQFVLSIADNDIIKLGVDLLEGLLTVINGITKSLPGFTSGLANILIVWGALVAGGKFLNASLTALSAKFAAGGQAAGISFKTALAQEFSGIGKIFTKAGWTVPPLHTEKQVMALKKLEGAQREVVVSQKFYDQAMSGNIASDNLRAKLKVRAANAERDYATAVTEAGTALGLNATQQAAFSELTAAGVAPTLAATTAQNGLTAEREEDIIATLMQNGMSEDAARAKLDEMVANEGLNRVKEEENVVDKLSLTQKLGLLASIIFSTKAKKAENAEHYKGVLAKLEESGATWTLAIANWALNASMVVVLGTILAIAAAIVLLVIGIGAIVKAIKNNTPEAKMKKLKEETEAAAQAADEAKQAYQDMVEQKKSYDELISGMQELTVGTQEWTSALYEANQQILDIIEKYPELIQYLESENGQLSIRDEGWKVMIQNQERVARAAQTISAMRQMRQAGTTFNESLSTTKKMMGGSSTWGTVDLGGQKATKLAGEVASLFATNPEAFVPKKGEYRQNEGYHYTYYGTTYSVPVMPTKEEGYNIYSQELLDLAKEYGVTAHSIYTDLDKFLAYDQSYSKNVLAILESGTSEQLRQSVYGANVVDSLYRSLDLTSVINANKTEWREGAKDGLWKEASDKTTQALIDKIQEYDKAHGTTTDITSSETETMANYYKTLTGEDFNTKEAGSGADDQLAEKIAEAEAAVEVGDYGDELLKIVRGNQQLRHLYGNNLDADYSELDVDSMGIDEQYKNAIKEQQKNIEKRKEDSDRKIAKIMGEDYQEGTSKQIAGSYSEAQELLKAYDQIKVVAGEAGATIFTDIFKDLDPEKAKDFSEEIASVDWSSPIEGAAALKKYLTGTDDALKEFALGMGIASSTVYSLSSQVNELYAILGDETLSKLAEDGEITAAEILELADSSEGLRTVLDTTGISANTLASYYEKLKKGTLSMVGASSNFVKVLEKLNAASNAVQDSFAFIDTFEPERSQTEIGSSFYEMQQTMRELYDKGAYGDAQLIDYVKEFIGPENWGELVREKGGDYKKALDEVFGYLPENGENFYQSWKKFANMDNGGMASMGSGGSINFNLDSIKTVENLRNELMKKLDISDTLADAMIADAQTFTANLEQGLKRLSLEDALADWIGGAITLNGKRVVSEAELKAIAEDAGLSPVELAEIFEQEPIAAEISVVPYLNSDGTLTDEVRDEIIKEFQDAGEVDLNLALEMIMSVGLDADRAREELLSMGESFQGMEVTVDGESKGKVGEEISLEFADSTKDGTYAGIVAGLNEQAVIDAQTISALRQAQITAKAMTVAMTVAMNGWVATLPVDLQMQLGFRTGIVEDNVKFVEDYYNDEIDSATDQLDKALEQNANGGAPDSTTQTLLERIMSAILSRGSGAGSGSLSGYEGPGAQTTKGDNSSNEWENEYDKHYNLSQKINAELRKREQLEREYERILERNGTTAEALLENRRAQLDSLEEERKMREQMLKNRINGAQEIESEYADLQKYAWFDEGLGKVQIDWNAIERLDGSTNEELTSRLDDYISKLEEQQDLIEEEQDTLEDIDDKVWEVYQQGEDSYFDLEGQIKQAIISSRQEEIDKLQDINDSVTDLNSSLVDALQKQVDDYRTLRDNEQKEEDIAEKQKRLAYLQQDTSGANQQEIMKLREELDSDMQDYTDSLVDQKIEQLQEQNDAAAEQRQHQIDLLQAQLDNYSKSKDIWTDVNELMKTGISAIGNLIDGSELSELLKGEAGWSAMSALEKMKWLENTNDTISEAVGWLKLGAVQSLSSEGQTVSFKDKNGDWLSGIFDKNGNIITSEGTFGADTLSMDALGNITSSTAIKPKSSTKVETKEESKERPIPTTNEKKGVSAAIWSGGYGWGSGATRRERLKEVFGANNDVQANYINKNVTSGYSGKVSDYSYSKMKAKYAFKTGGLADFTGPAWLDGTKSKPEYVLNADQTKAFFTLVDVLQGLRTMSQNNASTENHGDNVYDIDINVESIGSNYDVEQMARAVRQIIVDDATYRNTNAINLKR